MSESTNSTPDTSSEPTTEKIADLSLNLDEVLDMDLALGSLAGLRNSAAYDATEKSQRRYDARNHRLHEARMKNIGLPGGDGGEPEAEEMSQQVLIRSPITHNHYPPTPVTPEPVKQPAPDRSWLPWAVVALSMIPASIFAWQLPKIFTPADKPPVVNTDTRNTIRPDDQP
ncbi:MAG TPA: hypothetical protein VMX74_13200 [Pirellulales bacterium]|nr:hypothetical protein [Pirellulales bacterium]